MSMCDIFVAFRIIFIIHEKTMSTKLPKIVASSLSMYSYFFAFVQVILHWNMHIIP